MGKDKVKTAKDGSVEAALKECAGGSDDQTSRFLVIGYENKNTLTVLASGEGGVADVIPFFKPKEVCFALVRMAHQVELAKTVKIAYICWSPDNIPIMRKALLSVHKPQVKEILKPFHVMVEIEHESDIETLADDVADKIGFSSGTKVHVTEKAAYAAAGGAISAGPNTTAGARKAMAASETFRGGRKGNLVAASAQKNRLLKFEDEEAVRAAVKAVMADSDETDWCLVGYKDIKTLQLKGSGTGGPDAMAAAMDDQDVWYGYFRVTEQYDRSTTVKFGYVTLMTQNLAAVKRAKVSTHRGFVTEIFQPNHVEFAISHPSEINLEIAMEKLGSYTGTASKVTNKRESHLSNRMYVPKAQEHLVEVETAPTESVKFDDRAGLDAAIADVRSDSSDTDYLCCRWEPKSNTLELTATAAGGFDGLMGSMTDGDAQFGLLRTTDQVDNTVAVKFVYIKYQPASLAPTYKAKISTKKGVIDPLFAPYHVDFWVESKDDLTADIVADKVSAMAGTKQWAS